MNSRLLRSGTFLLAMLIVLLPLHASACTCSGSGFSVEGAGADMPPTQVYGILPSEFSGHTYCASHLGADLYSGCANPPASNTSTNTSTSTGMGTSGAAETFRSNLTASLNFSAMNAKSSASDGSQSNSIGAAKTVAELGASQAATAGAIFCAQGANANINSPADAATFYANCMQNFVAANAMSDQQNGYTPDQTLINSISGQTALQNFEKNFGISPTEYINRMLGRGGGPTNIPSLVSGKVSEAKLSEAFEAATKVDAIAEEQNSDQFSVNLGGGKKKNVSSLRDTLKKIMDSAAENSRKTASKNQASGKGKVDVKEEIDGLTPLRDDLFALNSSPAEVTIFDVVRIKYQELTSRWKEQLKLLPAKKK